jgi:hypothetical protein
MLEQFRAGYRRWCQRQEHVRQERQALDAVPRLDIDPSRLRPLSRPALDKLLRSPLVNAEWPEVKILLDRVMVIEDGKTGGVNVGDRRALYYLVRALRPRRVLEIGTDVGASTMSIAATQRRGTRRNRVHHRRHRGH